MVGPGNVPKITAATAAFYSKVTDPKAAILTAYNYVVGAVSALFQKKNRNHTPDLFSCSLKLVYFSFTTLLRHLPGYLMPSWQFRI